MRVFRDRSQAGRLLAQRLQRYQGRPDVIVLALPRGGVPVAYEIATELKVPLDVFIVRKLGVPGEEELAMGAIASGGVCVLSHDLIRALELSDEEVERVAAREWAELQRRERVFRGDRPFPSLEGRVVILVDDGIATGATMRAAIRAVRAHRPARISVATPVGAPQALEALQDEADELICLLSPESLMGIGAWYQDFRQLTDAEVLAYLQRAQEGATGADAHAQPATAN
ncbi:MAG: phosphoribosyltransferase [Thermoflexales bacterium]|nr:phosphoribosyltransferase [Thermoflexales bacterium]MDW8352278.1 phosphoribosyltransferase [Anaerolineae bacterium]